MWLLQIKKIEFLFFLLIICFITCIFHPLETFSDGMDFLMGGYFLGIPHPPSYPVYTQIIYLTKYLPIGNLALRINLFTTLLSFTFLFFFYKYLKGNFYEKILCILLILFSSTYLQNSINGELYVLNLLLIFLMFFFSEKEDKRFLYLSAFILGIGIGVHHTIVFIGLYLFLKYLFDKRKISFTDFSICSFLIILGLTVYLYLPFRAIKEPLWNWGNPRNFILFLNSFFRHDFQSYGFLRDVQTLLQQIVSFNPFYEFGIVNGIILLLSVVVLFFYDKANFNKSVSFISFFFVGFLLVVGNDNLSFEERVKTYSVFYLPAYVMFVYAFNIVLVKLKYNIKPFILLIVVLGIGYNFYSFLIKEITYEKAVFPHDYGRMSLAMLPRNKSTLIIAGGEKDFPILYQQKICKFREDIKLVNLVFLGKIWNLKESLGLGVAYKPSNTEGMGTKSIIKSVILYQKEVVKNRVFTNYFNNDELPDMNWILNGLYQEVDGQRDLDVKYFFRYRGKGGDDNFIENILELNRINGEKK